MSNFSSKPIYIVDGTRTPFLKAQKGPGKFAASDLAVFSGRNLLLRQPFAASDIDEVILGCMMPSENEANIGRLVGLRLGCGEKTPGWTVQRNCASGMQSLDCAIKNIMLDRSQLVLAGGTEAMSRAPLIFNEKMVRWFAAMNSKRSVMGRLAQFARFRPSFLVPIIALLKGLTDPVIGLNMPETAEVIAHRFDITRQQMDEFALLSQQRAAQAQDQGHYEEITPIYDANGKYYVEDDGVRRDSKLEKLASLRSITDKRFGLISAGNSSQVTDGAALLLLAGEEAINRYNLKPMARILDIEWDALNPEVMGLGPVYSSTAILKRNNLGLNDIDYWELNEAFAAQVLGCLEAWKNEKFCQDELGLEHALGELDLNKLNVDGGAIALGHPVGASGARIVMHLAHVLKRNNAKMGMATICIGGGQGGSMLIESL